MEHFFIFLWYLFFKDLLLEQIFNVCLLIYYKAQSNIVIKFLLQKNAVNYHFAETGSCILDIKSNISNSLFFEKEENKNITIHVLNINKCLTLPAGSSFSEEVIFDLEKKKSILVVRRMFFHTKQK